ncbi:hypothetical protein LSH36_163g00018 [Paralvinella palmiformis]|uniref:glutaminase n=1 Tax=Paralvinella palmiformis TaxID=53620 RepID=A0AAD9N9A0_9ANNE|nr:hypothetical protein LSH36_163g00018 [Paralvinella palmiformis]
MYSNIEKSHVRTVIGENIDIIQRAFTAELVIPEFKEFKTTLDELYQRIKQNKGGTPASYIPQLARVNPNYWGLSLCTIDGQRHSVGDTKIPFSIQSTSKPINYALAVSEMGGDEVHRYVGHEPSGESFNHIKLGHGNKPHNPMINAGAIMVASLLKRKLKLADRFDSVPRDDLNGPESKCNPEQLEHADSHVQPKLQGDDPHRKKVQNSFRKLSGGEFVGFSNTTFLSERETADRNFALAYYMKENKCFPEDHFVLHENLDFYFQVGLPAKSGVSGIIMLVIPNVAGICLWSPPLDKFGNSVRGIQFCEELVKLFNFHHYDNLRHTLQKMDPRIRRVDVQGSHVVKLLFSASNGDLTALRRMALAGNNMEAVDYDGRSALHLAAAEGQLECVRFLLEKCKVDANPKDRWGQTPYDDAVKFGKEQVAAFLDRVAEK